MKFKREIPKSPIIGLKSDGGDNLFRYFLAGVVILAMILMIVQLSTKPKFLEEKNMRLSFNAETKRDMKNFGLKVPLYSEPTGESEIVKYYEDPEEKFILLERQKKIWIRVVDEDQDTGWLSVFFLKKDLTN